MRKKKYPFNNKKRKSTALIIMMIMVIPRQTIAPKSDWAEKPLRKEAENSNQKFGLSLQFKGELEGRED